MSEKWMALERLSEERADKAGPEELGRLCALAAEASGARRGEIALLSGGKWAHGGGGGLPGGKPIGSERREALCELALGRGAWRSPMERGGREMAFLLRDRGEPIGVWMAFGDEGEGAFGSESFAAGRAAAAALAARIREARARGLLESRFAVAALAGIGASGAEAERMLAADPERAARLLAKGFCAEMARCGIGPKHALAAGIEVIGQATRMVERHGKAPSGTEGGKPEKGSAP